MQIIEDLLTFENNSDQFKKYTSLKLNQTVIQQIVPLAISTYVNPTAIRNVIKKNREKKKY
jgi:hypothetical protein